MSTLARPLPPVQLPLIREANAPAQPYAEWMRSLDDFLNKGFVTARVATDVSYTNNNVLSPVPGLSIPLQAGRSYMFEICAFWTFLAAAGIQLSLNTDGVLTTSNLVLSSMGLDSNVVSIGGAVGSAFTTLYAYNGTGSSAFIISRGALTVNAAGSIVVQAAQRVANATPTVLKQGTTFSIRDMT